jgi:hypothetical protein
MVFVILTLYCIAAGNIQAADPIDVVKVRNEQPNTFDFGERCSFETTIPSEVPVRLRVIRGTRRSLISFGNSRHNVRAGCIPYRSLVIRPERDGNELDLRFYLDEYWLSPDTRRNGQFVFIVERDDDPDGPFWEPEMFLLPADATKVAAYFSAGVDVTVTKPRHVTIRRGSRGSATSASYAPSNDCVDPRYDRRPPSIMQAHKTRGETMAVAAGSQ